jgi:hypothetical protein
MTKRKRRSRPQSAAFRRAEPAVPESRAAEAVTVAWMLTTLATLGAEAIAFIGWAVLALVPGGDRAPTQLLALPPLMLFTASVMGIFCLVLVGVVHRTRSVPPPTAVTMGSVAISLLPLLVAIAFILR